MPSSDQTATVEMQGMSRVEYLTECMNRALTAAQTARRLGSWRDADRYVSCAAEYRRLRQDAEEGALCQTQTASTL